MVGKDRIISHDFGGEKREAARQLRRFLDLDALHEANIRENPLPYLERANERIFQFQTVLFEAHQALEGSGKESPKGETVTVDKDQYQRLVKSAQVLEEAYARLMSPEPK